MNLPTALFVLVACMFSLGVLGLTFFGTAGGLVGLMFGTMIGARICFYLARPKKPNQEV